MQVNYIGFADSITVENKVYYYLLLLLLFLVTSVIQQQLNKQVYLRNSDQCYLANVMVLWLQFYGFC